MSMGEINILTLLMFFPLHVTYDTSTYAWINPHMDE